MNPKHPYGHLAVVPISRLFLMHPKQILGIAAPLAVRYNPLVSQKRRILGEEYATLALKTASSIP